MASSFAPPASRSSHSHLFGAVDVDDLVRAAVRLGYRELALTDRNNLCGAPRFLQVAREHGLHPILGVELTDRETSAVVLARDVEGYANLCRLVSRRQLLLGRGGEEHDEDFSLAADLPERGAGLFVLVEDVELAAVLARRVPASSLFLRLVRPGRRETHERRLMEASSRLGLPVVASGDPSFLSPAGHQAHRLLVAIARNRTIDEIEDGDLGLLSSESWLRGPDEMARLFGDMPETVSRGIDMARACAVPLPPRGRVLPTLEAGKAGDPAEDAEKLRALCDEGMRWRYGFVVPAGVRDRLAHELDIIVRLGFAGYFLVVHEIVLYSRSVGAPVAGRGSGGSSLVAFLLGITNVDPVRFGIAFERFLNMGRKDAPDLDVDFCWRVRDDIIEHVYERFGCERVAMVCTHITFQAKGAFREAARAFGLSDEQVTALRGDLPAGFDALDLEDALHLSRDVARVRPPLFRSIVRAAASIRGFPRHLSVHPGGIVITPHPIDGYAPLELAAKGVVVTQYDKDGVEDMGLVKIDLLGNRALSTTREAVNVTREIDGIGLDVERLPDGDPETVQLLVTADTLGCNQLESPAMRNLLAQVRPRDVQGVMRTLALIRPGAASLGGKEDFVRRARGLAAPLYADERLEPILRDGYGVCLYEDDTMLVARALAGIDGAEADRLRKGITKARTDDVRLELSRRFLAACDANGTARGVAEHMWVQMAKFNSYSFCKAHAASYGTIAYAVAYLKAHHPVSFWVGALNNNQGLYEKRVYVEEAKRHGIRCLPPCVHRSGAEFQRQGTAIRVGLSQVRDLSERVQGEILAARPFRDLQDLLRRTTISRPEAENLIACGACDGFGKTRPRLLVDLHLHLPAARKERGSSPLFEGAAGAPAEEGRGLPALADWSDGEKLRRELRILELSVREHPLAALRPLLDPVDVRGTVTSRFFPPAGRRVRVVGVLDTLRRVDTEAGDEMEFLTFEDEWGVFEVTLFPAAYAAFARRVRGWGPYLVDGRMEDHLGAVTITCDRIRTLKLRKDAACASA